MKLLVTIAFSLYLSAIAGSVVAQDPNPDWIELSPPGESFRVSMPNQARVENDMVGAVRGLRYTTTTGVASYTVWSLTNSNYHPNQDPELYLDACAELIWEGLLKPARDRLDDKERAIARMTYVRALPAEKSTSPATTPGLPGREYSLTIGEVTGTTEFFIAQEHVYVVLAVGKPGGDWPRQRFFASFQTSATSPLSQPQFGSGILAPQPGARVDDPNHVFNGREVTRKASVLQKPEPTYTDSARKFGVRGTVIMRCVFSKDGEVARIYVVQRLPHGLTEKAIAAARAIRFTPATKDGEPVSMWMQLEYNFNLY